MGRGICLLHVRLPAQAASERALAALAAEALEASAAPIGADAAARACAGTERRRRARAVAHSAGGIVELAATALADGELARPRHRVVVRARAAEHKAGADALDCDAAVWAPRIRAAVASA